MFSTLLDGLAFQAGVTNSLANLNTTFARLNSSIAQSTAELFIEAS
jgi:hypothetical protein